MIPAACETFLKEAVEPALFQHFDCRFFELVDVLVQDDDVQIIHPVRHVLVPDVPDHGSCKEVILDVMGVEY